MQLEERRLDLRLLAPVASLDQARHRHEESHHRHDETGTVWKESDTLQWTTLCQSLSSEQEIPVSLA